MSVIIWVVVGLAAGYITGALVYKDGEALPMRIGIGVVGAVTAGWLFNTFGPTGGTEFSLWSVPVSLIGAGLFLAAWHGIRHLAIRA